MGSMESLIIIISISFLVFIITREFFCWYFKFNKMVKLQESQIKLLMKIAKVDEEEN